MEDKRLGASRHSIRVKYDPDGFIGSHSTCSRCVPEVPYLMVFLYGAFALIDRILTSNKKVRYEWYLPKSGYLSTYETRIPANVAFFGRRFCWPH